MPENECRVELFYSRKSSRFFVVAEDKFVTKTWNATGVFLCSTLISNFFRTHPVLKLYIVGI